MVSKLQGIGCCNGMILLLDMNISPNLVDLLHCQQIDARHWRELGKYDATDVEIMSYARDNNCIVVTYDLDFSAILSVTQVRKPSIVQIRKQGLYLPLLAELLSAAVRHWAAELENGAILTLDSKRGRVRLLPLTQT